MICNIKEKKISFRLSIKDYDILCSLSRKCGMSISQYLRMILDRTLITGGISNYENK